MTSTPSPGWLHASRSRPLCIAHRGASEYAYDNSREAFERAVRLGAGWFEVDVRITADDHMVVWHDPTTRALGGHPRRIDELGWLELQALATDADRTILLFDEVLDIAERYAIGVYVDAKDEAAVMRAADRLSARGVDKGVIASYNVQSLQGLARRGCAYPCAMLVPAGGDPVALAERSGASIVHLCWANAGRAQQSRLDRELLERLHDAGLAVVLWHQENPAIVERWLTLPVLGICSNQPELLRSYRHQTAAWKPQIMCEGGIGFVAPPQSLPSATVAFNAGYDYVRVDTGVTADGRAVTVDRTATRQRLGGDFDLSAFTYEALCSLDTGADFDPCFAGTPVATLDEMLALAGSRDRGLAIEVTPQTLKTLVAGVSHRNALASSLFWSEQPACLPDLRAHAPLARIMAQRRHYDSLDETVQASGAQLVEFDAQSDDLQELVQCTARGIAAVIRYRGSDHDVLRRLIIARPTIVSVERPDLLRTLL